MLALTEPTCTGSGRSPSKTSARAAISIGSPSRVAVPWVSTREMSAGARPASASAARIGDLRLAARHRQGAAPAAVVDRRAPDHRVDPVVVAFGVVEPLEHDRDRASPGTNPSARSSNGRGRVSDARAPSWLRLR